MKKGYLAGWIASLIISVDPESSITFVKRRVMQNERDLRRQKD